MFCSILCQYDPTIVFPVCTTLWSTCLVFKCAYRKTDLTWMTMLLQQCWVRVLGSHRPRLIVFYCMFQTFLLIHCQCVRDHCDAKKLITQLPGGYTVDHNLTVPLHIHNLINFDKIPKTSGWNEKPKTSLLIFDKHIDSLYLKIEWIPPSDLLPPIFS